MRKLSAHVIEYAKAVAADAQEQPASPQPPSPTLLDGTIDDRELRGEIMNSALLAARESGESG